MLFRMTALLLCPRLGLEVLEVGVLTWSLAIMFVPLVAGFMPGLVLSRILVGIGEGVSPSAATDLIAGTILYASGYFTRICNYTFGHYKHRRSVAGTIGVALTDYLLDSTESWSAFLFAPSIFFYLAGTVVWLTFASSRPQKFSKTE